MGSDEVAGAGVVFVVVEVHVVYFPVFDENDVFDFSSEGDFVAFVPLDYEVAPLVESLELFAVAGGHGGRIAGFGDQSNLARDLLGAIFEFDFLVFGQNGPD